MDDVISRIIMAVILGGAVFGFYSLSQINKECAVKCHPYSVWQAGESRCICDKTKEVR